MCGIIGYAGHRPAATVIMEGLKRLEYRGYDSAGIALLQGKNLEIIKSPGKLSGLEEKLSQHNLSMALSGVGHTRWATHGLPNEANAHPHTDTAERLAVGHNGIIENYETLREELKGEGCTFYSQTDSEVLVKLIAKGIAEHDGDIAAAMAWAIGRVEGTYAIVLTSLDEPGVIYGARQSSPLVLGLGQGENFLASDIPAFLPYTRDVVFLDDGDLVRIDAEGYTVYSAADLSEISKDVNHINWDVQAAQKGGYKHFMLKEIFEQPRVIRDCCAGRVDWERHSVVLPELEPLEVPKRLVIIACGTSFHAGLWAMQLLERWAGIPTRVEIASEFRYRDVILEEGEAALVISQSGETMDTLAGLQLARDHGAPVIGLCNVVGSSIARESDTVVYTQAGPEISVASTKAMCSQLAVLSLMALYWGARKNTLPEGVQRDALDALDKLPGMLEGELPRMREEARKLAAAYADSTSFLFLGRGLYFPMALEGALKLKEISYIHAEGYAAGEMKHGPIALIDPKFPTFALAFNDSLYPKVKSNLVEVQSRHGRIIALTHPNTDLQVDDLWIVPEVWGPLNVFIALPALQLFAYETADYLGKDVDQPRNLAKSVTVE